MPIHDYRCQDCQGVTSVLSYSWSKKADPVCSGCGSGNLGKLISGFSFRASWGDSLNWVPSGETSRDVDEDSHQSIDNYMGRIKHEMGGQVTSDFDQMRKEWTTDS